MKKMTLVIILVTISTFIFAQIGTHIPTTRLPQTEPYWQDPSQDVLPWQNAGCLKQIKADGGIYIDKFIDVTQDFCNDF